MFEGEAAAQQPSVEVDRATLDGFMVSFKDAAVPSLQDHCVCSVISYFHDFHKAVHESLTAAINKAIVDAATSVLSKEGT